MQSTFTVFVFSYTLSGSDLHLAERALHCDLPALRALLHRASQQRIFLCRYFPLGFCLSFPQLFPSTLALTVYRHQHVHSCSCTSSSTCRRIARIWSSSRPSPHWTSSSAATLSSFSGTCCFLYHRYSLFLPHCRSPHVCVWVYRDPDACGQDTQVLAATLQLLV